MSQIIRPGEVNGPVPEIPFLHLPERRTVFAARAARLRSRAEGHAIGGYLRLMAAVAEAQQAELDGHPEVALPDERQRRLCRDHGLPPVSVTGWRRSPAWREGLRGLVSRLAGQALPGAASAAVERLRATPDAELEALAERVLGADYSRLDPALGPLVAAALQVHWTHLVTVLDAQAFGRTEPPNLCPACGSRPVASIVRVGAAAHGLRYLACSLCATQWHMVRAKCVVCEGSKDLAYYGLESPGDGDSGGVDREAAGQGGGAGERHGEASNGASGPRFRTDAGGRQAAQRLSEVRAEACDACRTYLKIAWMERDLAAEPTADDLATIGLDLMMAEAGYQRFGASPLLVPGPG
jgi:FdhE protein